jgi:hypothetical protein
VQGEAEVERDAVVLRVGLARAPVQVDGSGGVPLAAGAIGEIAHDHAPSRPDARFAVAQRVECRDEEAARPRFVRVPDGGRQATRHVIVVVTCQRWPVMTSRSDPPCRREVLFEEPCHPANRDCVCALGIEQQSRRHRGAPSRARSSA